MTTTPTQWLPNTIVNPILDEGRFAEASLVVGLSNGNFVVTYSEGSLTNDDIPDLPFDQRGVLFDAQGNVLNADLGLNQTDSGLVGIGGFNRIVADDAGGFYVLYSDFADDNETLFLERYDASGTLIADIVVVGTNTDDGLLTGTSLAVDTNGNVHVSYVLADGLATINPTLMVILDSDLNPIAGTPANPLTLIADQDPTDESSVSLVEATDLSNGNVAYATSLNFADSVNLFIVDGTTGAEITNIEVRPDQGGNIGVRNVYIEALSDGSIVVVWREFVNRFPFLDDEILSARFDVDGVQIGSTRVLELPEDQSSFRIEDLLALDDGGYFVVTYERSGAEAIQGTRFDEDGNVIGETMATLIPNVTHSTEPKASLTSDGRILITYTDENDAVQVSIFDPRDTVIDAELGDGQTTARLDGDTTINGTTDGETLLGQNGDDTLNGEAGDDNLFGGNGKDSLFGDDGDDSLFGGSGADDLFGGAGADRILGDNSGDVINGGSGDDFLFGNKGDDTISGGDGVDRISGGESKDVLFGGGGNDVITGGNNVDEIRGQSGDDDIKGNRGNDDLRGGSGDDFIRGNDGRDTILGGDDNDDLRGGGGDDRVFGGNGNDVLLGGNGNDVLSGGAGVDVLTGGNQADFFEFRTGDDSVTVLDFENNSDVFRIEAALNGGTTNIGDFLAEFGSIVDGNAVLDFGNGDVLTINGVSTLGRIGNDIEFV